MAGGLTRSETLGPEVEMAHAAGGLHVWCFTLHRMNDGPVLGHEEEVGRRTTFRLFYPESVFSDPKHNDPNSTVILTAFKPHDLKWLWELLTGGKIVSWHINLPSDYLQVFFSHENDSY